MEVFILANAILSEFWNLKKIIYSVLLFVLDLNDPSVFRDLSKPIGALNEDRIEKTRVTILTLIDVFIKISFVFTF